MELKSTTISNIEEFTYYYPNGNRITLQMRWFNLIMNNDLHADNFL